MVALNAIVATSLLFLLTNMHLSEAGRVLLDKQETKLTMKKNLGFVESELKSTTPPAGPNPHSNIPTPTTPTKGNNHVATSTIDQRNYAGRSISTIENSIKNKLPALMESKQQGPVPRGGHNSATNVPGPAPPSRNAASVINQRNYAGLLRMPTLTSGSRC